MRLRRLTIGILFPFLASCAGHRVIGSGKALVTLGRADLKELREAFRTTDEKTISLPSLGEIACEERRCTLAIQGNAPVYEREALVDHAKIPGVLVFGPSIAPFLIAKSEEAGERDKDFRQTSDEGQVSCNGRRCVLEFTFTKGSSVLLDAASEHLVWRAERR